MAPREVNFALRMLDRQTAGWRPKESLSSLPPSARQPDLTVLAKIPRLVERLRAAVTNGTVEQVASAVNEVIRKLVDDPDASLGPVAPNGQVGGGGEEMDVDGVAADPGGAAMEEDVSADEELHPGSHNHEDGEHHHDHDGPDVEHRDRRLDRDVFVQLGGPELLQQVVMPKQMPRDAREFSEEAIYAFAEPLNEALVTLRELSYSEPGLGERLATPEFLAFLTTLTAHHTAFDNAVGLLEELLVTAPNTFDLQLVPRFCELVASFGVRQLAVFCRVLSLVLLETEDRRLEEAKTVARSRELLQLRRARAEQRGAVAERNQAVALAVPHLCHRLVTLLRLSSRARPIGREAHPIAPDGLEMLLDLQGELQPDQEWETVHFLVGRASRGGRNYPPAPQASAIAGLQQSGNLVRWLWRLLRGPAEMAVAVAAAAVNGVSRSNNANNDGGGGGVPAAVGETNAAAQGAQEGANARAAAAAEASNANPVGGANNNVAVNLNAGGERVHLEPQDQQDLLDALRGLLAGDPAEMMQVLQTIQQAHPEALVLGHASLRQSRNLTPRQAMLALQLHALFLAPHQVEVLFVLNTLAGGTRKADVQAKLAAEGLMEALEDTFVLLNWGAAPAGPHAMQIHGPGCECSPESALRVQFLRFVHTLCNRDCPGSEVKRLLLSPSERSFLASGTLSVHNGAVVYVKHSAAASGGAEKTASASSSEPPPTQAAPLKAAAAAGGGAASFAGTTPGLLMSIVNVFMRERPDSVYLFWMSSVVEGYLRGATAQEQLLVASTGLVNHLVSSILDGSFKRANSAQSAFDLLAELVKANAGVLSLLESCLSSSDRALRLSRAVNNSLVDSNVFLRSLVVSLEHFGLRSAASEPGAHDASSGANAMRESVVSGASREFLAPSSSGPPCYLTDAWCDAQPFSLDGVAGGGGGSGIGGSSGGGDCGNGDSAVGDASGAARSSFWWLGRRAATSSATARPAESWWDDIDDSDRSPQSSAPTGASCSSVAEGADLRLPTLTSLVDGDLHGLLHGLMSCVDLESVTTDNLCCFNTALLFLVFERRRGNLANVFRKLRETAPDVLWSFRRLLWFWQEYYARDGVDRLSLAVASHVRFDEWRSLVEELCADDGSPSALTSLTPLM